MRKRKGRHTIWILFGLFSVLLVACGATVAGPAVVDVEVESAIEVAEETIADAGNSEPETGSESPEVIDEVAETTAESDESVIETGTDDIEGDVDEVADVGSDEAEAEIEETAEPVEVDESSAEESSVETDESGTSETESTGTADSGPRILTVDDRYDLLVQITSDWTTNWERHTVPYTELLAGQLRDRIRSIDAPVFESLDSAGEWVEDNEPVLVYEGESVARAYPLQILTLHEIVNDVVADVPVAITFCPLCNSAVVFDRRLNGEVLEFGTSGLLRNSDLVMYDRTTESLWQQFTGEGLVGDLAGQRLTMLPSSLVSFANFRDAFPDGEVLSRDTGFPFSYGLNPYVGYDTFQHSLSQQGNFALFAGEVDDRLSAVERVVSIAFEDGVSVAYPVSDLAEVGIVNDSPGGHDVVVFHVAGTSSALDGDLVATGRDVGATGVFDPNLNGEKLTFSKDGDTIVDDQTGSVWNVLGQAIEGPLSGDALTPTVHGDHFWFSWAAFHPDTIIFGQ
jgi:hypothetical protein